MSTASVRAIERRVGVLLGWRCWSAERHEGLLRPIVNAGLSGSRASLTRRCVLSRPMTYPPRAVSAACGLSAIRCCSTKSAGRIRRPKASRAPGRTRVGRSRWGNIIEHERGWRAQFSYPTTLYLLSMTRCSPRHSGNGTRAGRLGGRDRDPRADLAKEPPPESAAPGDPEAESGPGRPGGNRVRPTTTPGSLTDPRAGAPGLGAGPRARRARARRSPLEEQRITAERQTLELERRRDETRRQQHGIANVGAMASLKRRLVEHGIKQSDVAERAGVSREQICNTWPVGASVGRSSRRGGALEREGQRRPARPKWRTDPESFGRPRRLRAVPSPGEPELT